MSDDMVAIPAAVARDIAAPAGDPVTAPKPGDVLTAEQARALPDGAVVESKVRIVVGGYAVHDLADQVRAGHSTVTLVSLPTPPDMAPGSVVLDDEGVAWTRAWFGAFSWYALVQGNPTTDWPDLAPRVVKVLHDAAVTP